MKRLRPFRLLPAALLGCAFAAAPARADFPEVSAADRALKSVPGEDNAPAVALFKNAEFWMMDLARQEASSRLTVRTRVKILTEEGRDDYGEVAIPHSSYVRLQSFRGRTVLPDGREVPVPADAKFRRKMSRQERRFVTSVAFPAVEVGAILDYEYELRFDSFFLLEPWYFSDEIPVLHSEIVYHVPPEIQARIWNRDPLKAGVQKEDKPVQRGILFRAWADKLPAIRSEPFDVPFADLASQIMVVPSIYDDGIQHTKLMEDWGATSDILANMYTDARRNIGAAKRKAKELTAAAGTTPRGKVTALYRFVRDEIETEDYEGIYAGRDGSPDTVLAERRGDPAEKALLLHTMLDAVKVDAKLVWASDRGAGLPDMQMPNPYWFQKMLVAVQLDGARVFLDPSDRSLALGQLQPGYEGSAAVLPDRKKPETITLPQTPFDANRREAKIELALDGAGVLAGSGRLAFAGQHAWQRLGWKGDSATPEEAWKKWLEEELEGFRVADVKVAEAVEDRHMEVSWTMKQREDDALGDEATLAPSRPFGPTQQPFVLTGGRRRSPVLFEFGDRDDLELSLRWPAGWKIEKAPKAVKHESAAGALAVAVEVDDAARALTYRRRLDITRKTFESRELFEAVRTLFAETEKSDGQPLVLVHG